MRYLAELIRKTLLESFEKEEEKFIVKLFARIYATAIMDHIEENVSGN